MKKEKIAIQAGYNKKKGNGEMAVPEADSDEESDP